MTSTKQFSSLNSINSSHQFRVSGYAVNQPSDAWEESLIECASVNTGRHIAGNPLFRMHPYIYGVPTTSETGFGVRFNFPANNFFTCLHIHGNRVFLPCTPSEESRTLWEGPRSQGFLDMDVWEFNLFMRDLLRARY